MDIKKRKCLISFSAVFLSKPIDVGILIPINSPIISNIIAIPIKPPDKIPAGLTKFFVAKAMISDDKNTALKLIKHCIFLSGGKKTSNFNYMW